MESSELHDWISVQKRLPTDNDDILIACDGFVVGLSAWYEDGRFYFMDGDPASDVTHWMCAPKTPHKKFD